MAQQPDQSGGASGPTEYDVIVIGAGAIGENVGARVVRGGLSAVVIEQSLVGGECSYWACMPSKALLRPGAALVAAKAVPGVVPDSVSGIDASATLARRDKFTSHWDDASQVKWLSDTGIDLIRGSGKLVGERAVQVTDSEGGTTTLTARHAVALCTGSKAKVPPIAGLQDVDFWTSREATSVSEVPPSLAIIGGGVVGCELATAYRDLGAQVTLIVRGATLLPGFEPFASDLVAENLQRMGVDVRFERQVVRVERGASGAGSARLILDDEATVVAAQVLVATGREPVTADLGLESVGIAPDGLQVDESMQVRGVPWLYAAGDVAQRSHTTHEGKYEARVAGDAIVRAVSGHAAAADDTRPLDGAWSPVRTLADDLGGPQVVFTRPEVAAVGLTQAAAADRYARVRAVDYQLGSVAGAALYADGYQGQARIVVDENRRVIVGATFAGPDVAEMLHAATIAVVGQVPLAALWHAVPSYPTVSEVWLRLLEEYGL